MQIKSRKCKKINEKWRMVLTDYERKSWTLNPYRLGTMNGEWFGAKYRLQVESEEKINKT